MLPKCHGVQGFEPSQGTTDLQWEEDTGSEVGGGTGMPSTLIA